MSENVNYEILGNRNDCAVIRLGEKVLGGHDAMDFSELLHDLTEKEIKYYLIDLENVQAMNSSGLGMLIAGSRQLAKTEGKMILISVPDKVRGILQATHLDQVFQSFDSTSDALKEFS